LQKFSILCGFVYENEYAMKSILITGASTGIGYACAEVFSQKGYRVLGSVRKEEDGAMLKEKLGDGVVPLQFDVTDRQAILESVSKVEEVTGGNGLSGLINNAGIAISGPVTLLDVDQYRRQLEVNLFGVIEVTKAFLPLLGAAKQRLHPPGRIINMSSVSGVLAFPFMSPYVSSKFALEGFSHTLRRELMIYGIDVIIVGPGPIKTPIWGKDHGIPEGVVDSDYGPAFKRFSDRTRRIAEEAMEATVMAQKVVAIFEKKKPKVRYTIQNDKFKNYTVPRYLIPARTLDKMIAKIFR
jgi:NAD(P)-dependent dehydrogenase (short-subunit alcohol dehydrogenase family)